MASFRNSLNFVLDNEDSQREYADVPDAPPGARAISGINSHSYPADYAHIAALPQAERGPAVAAFYAANFWDHWLAEVASDPAAARIMDAEVNEGQGTGIRLAQEAANKARSSNLEIDGVWGPATVLAINACDPQEFVGCFRAARIARYQDLVKKNPARAVYLDNWITRAQK